LGRRSGRELLGRKIGGANSPERTQLLPLHHCAVANGFPGSEGGAITTKLEDRDRGSSGYGRTIIPKISIIIFLRAPLESWSITPPGRRAQPLREIRTSIMKAPGRYIRCKPERPWPCDRP
jgi:hypothetical protein